jgi:hypothetical protein
MITISIKNNNLKMTKSSLCKKRDCNVHEDLKVCLFMIIIISLTALTIIGISLCVNNNIKNDILSYESLIKNSKKTYVRSGYWLDRDRLCSVNDPCIMNCLEYSRYDLGCGPDDPECTYGHYDWCKDEPVGGQI